MTHKTLNDVSKKAKTIVLPLLQARLVDAIDLQLSAHQAHWNVKGPSFIALHELFDKVVDGANEAVDELAERIVQLGGVPDGTSRTVAKTTKLPAYPTDLTDGLEHCAALAGVIAAFAKSIRESIDTTATAGDANTADLLTGISRTTDKNLWFIEAHLQASN